MMTDMWVYLAQGYLMLFALQLVLWIIQLRTKDASTADIGWSVGMLVLIAWLAGNTEGYWLREVLIVGMIAIWSARLSIYLGVRLWKDNKEDSRYARLRDYWGEGAERNFIIVFQLQPIFNVILSIPLLIALSNNSPVITPIEWLAVALWILGLVGESMADQQLNAFRSNPQNKGKICQQGLWEYSRHPNFFFEWIMWVSYAVFASASPYGWYGWVAPIFMLFLLMKVTGIPAMEKYALKNKGAAFREYMKTTSFFVPLPPKLWQQFSRS